MDPNSPSVRFHTRWVAHRAVEMQDVPEPIGFWDVFVVFGSPKEEDSSSHYNTKTLFCSEAKPFGTHLSASSSFNHVWSSTT